jgi:hypothetical protein
MAVIRVAAQCSLLEVYRRFRGACCLHQHCETSAHFCQTTRHNNPEDSHVYIRRLEILKYHMRVKFTGSCFKNKMHIFNPGLWLFFAVPFEMRTSVTKVMTYEISGQEIFYLRGRVLSYISFLNRSLSQTASTLINVSNCLLGGFAHNVSNAVLSGRNLQIAS